MRCISFGGPRSFYKRRYCRNTLCIETDLVQEAIWRLYNPEEIILCLTNPAWATVASDLEGRDVPVKKLWIPYGTDEKQLFEIFTSISGVVRSGEDILFDISEGGQSLPFITFLAASYVRSIMQVTITGVIYSPPPGDDGFSRFVDLKPMMNILDWIEGVKAVTVYLDAKPVRELLKVVQGNIHRSGDFLQPPVRLSGWASILEQFCDSVRLARPVDAMYAASGVVNGIEPVSSELCMYAPSLIPVINVISSLSDIAAEPGSSDCSYEYVRHQVRLIRFQVEKGLYLQAVTLGREVLITLVMIRLGRGTFWKDADLRHQFSRTLTGGALGIQNKPYEKTEYSDDASNLGSWKEMVRIWLKISDLRNNFAHCGMNQRDDSVRSLKKRAMDIIPDIECFLEICEKEI